MFIVFQICYVVIVYVWYVLIDLVKVLFILDDLVLQFYLVECVLYMVFIFVLCVFLQCVVGVEINFYCIVQWLFDVVDWILWVGVWEYFMIFNISDYVLYVGYVDCGQQMLLLMILLCFNGILLCWQFGMVYFDDVVGYNNLYDWGVVYLVLYGWVLMDVIIGCLDSFEFVLCDFYFGGLDVYCIVFNDDYV